MTQTVSLPAEWRCMRNRGGAVIGLRTVAPPSPAHRSGLALSVTGPQEVIPGSIATYTVRVRNTRRGLSNRDISSLWSIRVQSNLIPVAKGTNVELHVLRPVVSRLTELRHGKTKLLRIRLRVPSGLKQASIHRVCLYTGAIADSARPGQRKSVLGCPDAVRRPRVGQGGELSGQVHYGRHFVPMCVCSAAAAAMPAARA